MTSPLFERGRLSKREDSILEAAIEGLTDIQIAQRMAISQSTVNSYWVRIRGKLGQLSRTELVALALKQKARTEMDLAQAQLALLRREAETHGRLTDDYANAEIYRAALDTLPEAMLVFCESAIIRYANPRVEALFGFERGELRELPLATLFPAGDREREMRRIEAYIADPRPLRMGFDGVLYGRRKNGSQFRIVLLLGSRTVCREPVFSCIVRDFANEITDRREHVASWI